MSDEQDGSERKRKTAESSAPPYGSQEYWDQRYKRNKEFSVENGRPDTREPRDGQIEPDDETLPYHAWYFTYQDLRPLILPLILGEKDKDTDFNDSDTCGEKQRKSGEQGGLESRDSHRPKSNLGEMQAEQSTPEHGDSKEVSGQVEDDSSDLEDEPEPREGLAKSGPISILEVGCGDVPLGKDLCVEFIELSRKTGETVGSILENVTCCDYSPTVINTMNDKKRQLGKEGDTLEVKLDSDGLATLDILLDYAVVDARTMPFKDKSYHLILEKGTLDAMLSDKDHGIANCVEIVKECARVLTLNGYIVIVSHLNAHTENGIDWLNKVVVPGLNEGGGKDAAWEIEVHGNDAMDDLDEQETSPSGSPGPCVYVIHKLVSKTATALSAEDEPTIPLKFFSY